MISVFGEDSKLNPVELKKEIIYQDKFKIEFLVKMDKKLSNHLIVQINNMINTNIAGNILLGTNNNMELVSEETSVIRTDFDTNKFLVRAPKGTNVDLYLNVCYGSVDM
jgi:hypothetical protein